jgi:hypothetical protein
VILLIC